MQHLGGGRQIFMLLLLFKETHLVMYKHRHIPLCSFSLMILRRRHPHMCSWIDETVPPSARTLIHCVPIRYVNTCRLVSFSIMWGFHKAP